LTSAILQSNVELQREFACSAMAQWLRVGAAEGFMDACATGALMERPELRSKCDDSTFADWLRLIQSEYFEMPGMHLTKRQVQRLWGMDAGCCETLLNALEASKFLKRT